MSILTEKVIKGAVWATVLADALFNLYPCAVL